MQEASQSTNKEIKKEDEVYAPESKLAGKNKQNTGGSKKDNKNKIKRRINPNSRFHFSPLELTMMIVGLFVAIGLVVIFYYMYDSARHSLRAIPQTGLISSDSDKTWLTRVVNANSGLPEEYEVTVSSVTGNPGAFVDSRATKDTVELLDDLKSHVNENVSIITGYTSVQDYINQFNSNVQRLMDEEYLSENEARTQTLATMMQPGTDEHSTGLLINFGIDGSLDPTTIANSQTYNWLVNNAYKYGYILRYPEGKEEVTLHGFDPSAFRYVGRELAKELHSSGQTLEEYNAMQAQIAADQAQAQAAAEEQQVTETVDETTN